MSKSRMAAVAAVVALGLAGTVAMPLLGAAHGWSAQESAEGRRMASWRGPEHVEGRIAFLKAELKITPDQAKEWDAVAQVMRRNAAAMTKLHEEMRKEQNAPKTAVEGLALRQQIAAARSKAITDFASAFKPLYDHMSDDQRKAADELLQAHVHHS